MGKKIKTQNSNKKVKESNTPNKANIEKTITKNENQPKFRRTKSILQTIQESNFVTIKRQRETVHNKKQQNKKFNNKVKKAKNQIKSKKQTQSKKTTIKKQKIQKTKILPQKIPQEDQIKQNLEQKSNQKIIKRLSSFEGNKFAPQEKIQFINQEILNEKTHELDEFFNFKEKFLGKEGVFTQYRVLIFFERQFQFWLTAGKELKKRGFHFDVVMNLEEFNKKIMDYDIVWILSYYYDELPQNKEENSPQKLLFVEQIGNFLKAKKSLFIWSDNDPLFQYTNLILKQYFNGMEMKGNYYGKQLVTKSNDNFEQDKKGKFDPQHSIFYGVNNLNEGDTICHPENIHPDFRVIAYNTNNEPLVLVAEENENHGRIILDTGFTKLYFMDWNEAGTHQYVSNANVWLTGIPD